MSKVLLQHDLLSKGVSVNELITPDMAIIVKSQAQPDIHGAVWRCTISIPTAATRLGEVYTDNGKLGSLPCRFFFST